MLIKVKNSGEIFSEAIIKGERSGKAAKLLFSGFLVIFLNVSVFAQDAHFSQYYASGLYLNPAMTGVYNNLSFTSNHRTQWRSIVIPYVTSQISIINPLYSKKGASETQIGGIGLSVYNDRAGDGNFKTLGMSVNAAYNLLLSRSGMHNMIFGLQGGFIQKNIDYTNLQWGEQYNPYLGFDATVNPNVGIRSGKIYPDVGAGFIYYFNPVKDYKNTGLSGFIGGSAYHLNMPNESFYNSFVSRLPVLYKAHAGIEGHISDKLNISPNGLFMLQRGKKQINAGLYLTYQFGEQKAALTPTDIIFGGWYRLKDSYIVSTGIGNKNYTLGFSYDFNSSSLRSNTQGRGAYEISLIISRVKEKHTRRFYTPRI